MAGNSNSGGRNKKPDALKKLIGTAQKCRINENSPKVSELTNISMPEDLILTKGGEKIWNSLSAELTKAGILKVTDLQSFAVYCNAFALYIEMSLYIKKNGAVYSDNNGNPKKRPEVTIMFETLRVVNSYQGRFGLTPADRDRIKVEREQADETENLFD